MANATTEDKLRRMQHNYMQDLPVRLDRVRLVWAEVRASRSDEAIGRLSGAVHAISGSGATFGYADLGATAARIEALLLRRGRDGHWPDADGSAAIDALIRQLGEDALKFDESASLFAPGKFRSKPD